jgi:hypothetical protein
MEPFREISLGSKRFKESLDEHIQIIDGILDRTSKSLGKLRIPP